MAAPTPIPARDPAPFRLGYNPSLDGLRGVACLVVLLTHLHVLPGGVVGADALMVLSGFLISALLVEEYQKRGNISLPTFYRKRFLRILPPLFALLLFGSVGSILLGYNTPTGALAEAGLAVTFLTNWHQSFGVGMPTAGHTWTLAVEVQFYLIWPVALTILLRYRVAPGCVLALAVLAIIASALLRLGLFALRPPGRLPEIAYLMRLYMGLATRADALLLGCVAGLLVAWRILPRSPRFLTHLRNGAWLSAGGLAYLLLRCHHEQHGFYCGLFTLDALMVATILTWLLLAPGSVFARVLAFRPLVGLGRISYALYLFHMPICSWVHGSGLPRNSALSLGLIAGLSLAAAILSYYLIERPVLSLKTWNGTTTELTDAVPSRAA